MSYSETVLRRAKERLAERVRNAERHTEQVYETYPRLREITTELKKTMLQVIAASFSHGEVAEAIAAAKSSNLALQREKETLLRESGLTEADLDPKSVCPKCGGSGYVGAVMCDCLHDLCREEQKKELSSLLDGAERFDTFRLDYYPAENNELGISPRRLMGKVFLRCRDYADGFSREAPSLLFSGGTGLGKTFLSACIARQVAEMGFSVVYETVVTILSDFEKEKFYSGDNARIEKYLSCDLLIVDDLGTELLTPFAQSALYQLINTRMVRHLPTVISTNLSPSELSATYLPQTTSRLLGTYELLQFFGKDIRMMQ